MEHEFISWITQNAVFLILSLCFISAYWPGGYRPQTSANFWLTGPFSIISSPLEVLKSFVNPYYIFPHWCDSYYFFCVMWSWQVFAVSENQSIAFKLMSVVTRWGSVHWPPRCKTIMLSSGLLLENTSLAINTPWSNNKAVSFHKASKTDWEGLGNKQRGAGFISHEICVRLVRNKYVHDLLENPRGRRRNRSRQIRC